METHRPHQTHETPSPASSITRLGIVRFVIGENAIASNDRIRGGIVELPAFTSEEPSRPTVQMPPLADPRDPPALSDDAFDPDCLDAPSRAASKRDRLSTLPGVAPFRAPTRPRPRNGPLLP